MQPQSPVRQVLTNSRHGQIAAVLATELLWQGETIVARGIGASTHLLQQLLPFRAWQAAIVPVCAGVLPPVVEEANVVIPFLERLDVGFDEGVKLLEIGLDLMRDFKVHANSLLLAHRTPGVSLTPPLPGLL